MKKRGTVAKKSGDPDSLLIDGDEVEIVDEPDVEIVADGSEEVAEWDEGDESAADSDTHDGVESKLKEDANKIIGDYFVKHSAALFDDEKNFISSTTLKCYAPLLSVVPSLISSASGKYKISYNLGSMSPDDARSALIQLVGPGVKNLDVYKNDTFVSNPEILVKFVPEIKGLMRIIGDSRRAKRGHPFVIPLTMKPEYRDLPIVAIANFGKLKEPFDLDEVGARSTLSVLSVPRFADMVEMAEKYGITQLQPILSELERAKEKYGISN